MTDPVYQHLADQGLCSLPDADGVLNGGPSPNGTSQTQGIMACPQQYAFEWLFGDRKERELTGALQEPLVRGTLVHVAMEHHWTARLVARHGGQATGLLDPVMAVQVFAMRADGAREAAGGEPGWYEHVELAQEAARLYLRTDPHRHVEPVAVEHVVALWFDDHGVEVAAPPDAAERLALAEAGRKADLYLRGAPWLSTFRVDLLGRLTDGRAAVIDWKTSYKVDARKRRGFELSLQMLQYLYWGHTRYREDFGGVYVGLVDFRKTGAGDGAKAFPMVGLPWHDAAVSRFGKAVRDRGQMLRRLLQETAAGARDVEDWPRAFGEQGPCSDRYGECWARRWCGEGVPADVARWTP